MSNPIPVARVSELLHGMLHAVGGPLGQMRRIAETIERRNSSEGEELRSWLSHLCSAGTHADEALHAMRRYVDILDLPSTSAQFALIQPLNRASSALRLNATITTGELPEVTADPRRLELLFTELLSNAAKFCDGPAAIHIRASQKGLDLVISVTDNGIGIPPDQMERIFRPFVRLQGHRFGGAGMGLTIARSLVESWNGRLWVESSCDVGSTFQFNLHSA